jgi:serine protease AprX
MRADTVIMTGYFKQKSLQIILVLSVLIAGLPRESTAQVVLGSYKLTPAAQNLVESLAGAETGTYWLYLDSAAADPKALQLSHRSLARRAKVDPVGFLIDWRDYPIADSVLEAIRAAGINVIRSSRWLKAVAVEADFSGVAKAVEMPLVRRIDPVKTLVRIVDDDVTSVKMLSAPKQSIDFDYGLALVQNQFIKAIKPHQVGLTGRGVLIAVLDTGFETDHPAFDSANVAAAYDFINDDATVNDSDCPESASSDQNFHGTSVFSVIGANVPGALVGVAPGADFLLAKTEISCNGTEIKVEEYNWIAAYEWADALGADIINSSVGYALFTDSGSYTFDDMDGNTTLITVVADIAASRNILVVNSVGNERIREWGHIIAPADGDSVLATGAVNPDSTVAAFSSPGPTADGRIKPDITTLGVGVAAAYHLGGYISVSGTSYSAPLTSGAAALALERDQALTAMELLDRIRRTGDRADNPDNDYGWGLLDAARVANLFIALDLPPRIQMRYDRDTILDVAITDWAGPTPSLRGVGLPPGVSFEDDGDGTGRLEISPHSDRLPLDTIRIQATVSDFSDTTEAVLDVFGLSEYAVSVGPNPFRDRVSIFIKLSVDNVQSISFFNAAGEIVWEKVNNFAANADATYGLLEQWDGRNREGKVVAAGVYILVVITDRQTYHVKLLKTN